MAFESASDAWARTGRMLFREFTLKKWAFLGFAAWLADLDVSRVMPNVTHAFSDRFGFEPGSSPPDVQELVSSLMQWVRENMTFLVTLVVVLFFARIVLSLIVLWVGARGQFVFLAGVARDNTEIKRPWHEFSTLGNSLFLWRFCYGIVIWLVVIGTAMLGGALAAVSVARPELLPFWLAGLIMAALILVLAAVLISVSLDDFVVPLMYRYQMKAMAAWSYFGRLVAQHAAGFVIYLLFRLVFTTGAVLLICALMLVTCCTPAAVFSIPYLGTCLGGFLATLVLLPVPVFFRCYSVYFLEKFHADYKILLDHRTSASDGGAAAVAQDAFALGSDPSPGPNGSGPSQPGAPNTSDPGR